MIVKGGGGGTGGSGAITVAIGQPSLFEDEWDLIDDALAYWQERLTYTLGRENAPPSVAAAGRTVRRRIVRLRAKIAPMVPPEPTEGTP